MFDIWIGDIDLTQLVMIVTAVVILPVQLLLCFKVKSLIIRFIPLIALFILAVAAIITYKDAVGWDGLGLVLVMMYEAFMLLMCGFGWGIWGLSNVVKKIARNK